MTAFHRSRSVGFPIHVIRAKGVLHIVSGKHRERATPAVNGRTPEQLIDYAEFAFHRLEDKVRAQWFMAHMPEASYGT